MSFKGYKRTIKLEFDYNEVKKGVPNAKRQMSVLNAEFKKSRAEALASGKEVDILGTKYDFLSNKIKIQAEDVEKYKKKLEKAKTATGNNTKAIENNTASLAIAKSKLEQTKAELKKVSKELEKHKTILKKSAQEWDDLGKKAQGLGKKMTFGVTLPIIAAASASFKLGASMQSTMGKVDVVFGKNSDAIKRWSENSLEQFGLAKLTALDMASSFGDMALGMGISLNKSSEMSKKLTELTMDIATFKDQSVDVTRTALNSIFTGETESLKKFGIVMTQANLQQFAFNKGIRKKINLMTEAEKTELRYEFVLEKTKLAMGNYKREQDEATAQMELFKQASIELGESFSEQIIPIFTPVLSFLNKTIKGFAGLSDGTKKFIVTLAGVVAVVGPTLFVLGGFFRSIRDINEGMKMTKGAISAVKGAGKLFSSTASNSAFFGFAKWAAIIAGVAIAIASLIAMLNILLGKGNEMNSFMNSVNGAKSSVNGAKYRGNNIGSYAVGSNYIADDQLAVIHKGEAVVPAESNPWNPEADTNNNIGGGDTFIFNIDPKNIREFNDLVEIAHTARQRKRAGGVLI